MWYNFAMRIVAGKYRGKKLKEFDINGTRPTLDRVREAIFDMIQFDIRGADVLDLFSGTGAMGVEALSRGANLVDFIDIEDSAIQVIKENLKGIEEEHSVIKKDALAYLNSCKKMYDIIFLDPPYKSGLYGEIVGVIAKNGILKSNGILIIEKDKCLDIGVDLTNFEIKSKTYGKIEVIKCTKKS